MSGWPKIFMIGFLLPVGVVGAAEGAVAAAAVAAAGAGELPKR